eukprot:g24491.t1
MVLERPGFGRATSIDNRARRKKQQRDLLVAQQRAEAFKKGIAAYFGEGFLDPTLIQPGPFPSYGHGAPRYPPAYPHYPPKPITRQHILTIPTKPILAVSPGWCHMQLFWNCIPRRNAMLGTLIRALREYFTQIFGKS